ncbi:uncharacterized protein KY384_000145 [Bacidia gigantensis]|uniref:uncharacterized protein n=1 Tax=Bacidia gigantensis TaxID=2732470 RepID=UPI001D03669F|nr:uncharacterized protein KY384_000145 [Bacidia gigantensis]KAG8526152.1 hypothetical protein KY384_000145 [Bacidia gigantensis]
MGDRSTNPTQGGVDPATNPPKGKGKADPQDVSMGEEEDSTSDEETGAEDDQKINSWRALNSPSSYFLMTEFVALQQSLNDQSDLTVEEEDDDNMEEIDTSNIRPSRTRGKQIDWRQAAEKNKDDLGDEDEDEDDDDFEGGEEDEEMAG